MGLRDRGAIKSPQRYDNENYEDCHVNGVRRGAHKEELVYRGPVIEYNPNLRPAVFPTIPLDQEVDESLFTAVAVNQDAPSVSQQLQRDPQTPQPDVGNGHQSVSSHTLSSHTALGFPSPTSLEMFILPSTDDRWSRELNRDLNTPPLRTSSPNMLAKPIAGIGSKVWSENMRNLDKFYKRTEADWNIAGMETSEEDEAEDTETQGPHNQKA